MDVNAVKLGLAQKILETREKVFLDKLNLYSSNQHRIGGMKQSD